MRGHIPIELIKILEPRKIRLHSITKKIEALI